MSTWFKFPGALVGVSNKAGSSSIRLFAGKRGYEEMSPANARAFSLREGHYPSVLLLRDPIERLESAYRYFTALGWPRLAGRGWRDAEEFARMVLSDPNPAGMDPHWVPQVLSHKVAGQRWWDYDAMFDQIHLIVYGIHENVGPAWYQIPGIRKHEHALRKGPYAEDYPGHPVSDAVLATMIHNPCLVP